MQNQPHFQIQLENDGVPKNWPKSPSESTAQMAACDATLKIGRLGHRV